VLASKIAHLLARPAADLHVTTKTLFLDRDAGHQKTIESNLKKDGFILVLLSKGVHQVYRLLLSRLFASIVKLDRRASIQMCRFISFPHTPARRSGEQQGSRQQRGPIGVCQSLFYFHSLRSAVSQFFFACLVGYRMVCLSLMHPANGEVPFVPTISIFDSHVPSCTSRTFSRSGLAGPVFHGFPAARPSRLRKVKRSVAKSGRAEIGR